MVNVTNGADIDVGFGALEGLFGHKINFLKVKKLQEPTKLLKWRLRSDLNLPEFLRNAL